MRKVIYTRYSDERDPAFSICTQIVQEEGGLRLVRKMAETPEASGHLRHICEAGKRLEELYAEDDSLQVNRCRQSGDVLELEYIDGTTLEEMLDDLLRRESPEPVMQALRDYIAEAIPEKALRPFEMTDGFREMFGDYTFPEDSMSLPVSDIDLICSNVLCRDGQKCLIDYEWTFAFPVPARFLIYRILYYYVAYGTSRAVLNRPDIFQEYGISEAEIDCFHEMEFTFQKHIQGGRVPLRAMYDRISPGAAEVARMLDQIEGHAGMGNFEVFYAYGGDIVPSPLSYQIRNGRVDLEIPVPENATLIRLDPGNLPCICQVQLLAFDGKKEKIPAFGTNGRHTSADVIVFDDIDPQIWFPVCEPRPAVLSVSLAVSHPEQNMLRSISGMIRENERYHERAEWLPRQAARVKNRVFRKK